MYINTLTISSKGQIVLPKKIRQILNSNVISLELNENNQVIITPINDIAGSLAAYKKDNDVSFEKIRDQAWKENIINKHSP